MLHLLFACALGNFAVGNIRICKEIISQRHFSQPYFVLTSRNKRKMEKKGEDLFHTKCFFMPRIRKTLPLHLSGTSVLYLWVRPYPEGISISKMLFLSLPPPTSCPDFPLSDVVFREQEAE